MQFIAELVPILLKVSGLTLCIIFDCRLFYEDFLYLVALTAYIETVFGIVHADALEVEVFYGCVGVKLCLDVGDAGLL